MLSLRNYSEGYKRSQPLNEINNALSGKIVLKISQLPSKLRFSANCSFFRQLFPDVPAAERGLFTKYVYWKLRVAICADYVKNCIKVRASRAARLLFLIQQIILLAIFWRC